MKYWEKIVELWQNKSITIKHRAGIGLLVFLMLIIASAGIFSLYLVQKADKAIRTNTSIQRLIFEIDREMETARRLQAGFFLYYPKIGLRKAHEDYAQPSIRKTAKVVSTSQALRELISHPEVSGAFRESKVDLNLYLSSAKRFADTSIESFELVTRLATPDNGLEDLLGKSIDELKAETSPIRELVYDTHDMEALINQYRIKRKRHLMQSAFNISFNLQNRIYTASFLDSSQKERIPFIINRIHGIANQILEIDVAIDSKFNDFVLQERAAHSVSEKFIALAKKEVAKAQQKISKTQYLNAGILIFVTLIGLAAAGIIANILNNNITRRIVQLTHVTKKMRKGQLDVLADESSRDELGNLGKTFNFMAARVKGLVDNLEQEVNDRTLELSETNKNLKMEIHERKQAENTIKQKEAFLNRVIDQSPFATWISDAHGTLERTNMALKKFLNVTDEEVVGKYNVLKDPILKRQHLIPLIRTVFEKGQTVHFACDWDGNDYPAMNLKGSNAVSIEATMFPVFSSQGELINVVLNWIDITERMKMETEKQVLEQQLRQSHKMEAIGTLAGGIAHDFNNILGIMLGNAELALSDTPEWSPALESLREIKTAGIRAKDVVRQLLSYSRKAEQNKTPQDLGKLIKDSIKLLRSSIPSRIQIIENISEQKQIVRADETQIHQVIINLSTNAAHAMEEKGGILGIHLDSFCLEKRSGGKYEKLSPGEYVELRVNDTGTGMAPEIIEKIFDPYYTTKEFGKGTGMGLAVVHGIIKSHDASIHVESSPDKGTTFSVFFPKLQKNEEEKISNKKEEPPQGTEKILFVDDEAAIVDVMSKILKKLGYQVIGETDPVKAIEKFEADSGNVDLLITDMTMPQMDGKELSKKLKQIKPGLPIIICTGHSETLDNKRALGMGLSAFAMKPVSMTEIAKKIREVLGNTDTFL